MCAGILPIHMHAPCTCWCPQKSEEGVRFPDTEVMNSGEDKAGARN